MMWATGVLNVCSWIYRGLGGWRTGQKLERTQSSALRIYSRERYGKRHQELSPNSAHSLRVYHAFFSQYLTSLVWVRDLKVMNAPDSFLWPVSVRI